MGLTDEKILAAKPIFLQQTTTRTCFNMFEYVASPKQQQQQEPPFPPFPSFQRLANTGIFPPHPHLWPARPAAPRRVALQPRQLAASPAVVPRRIGLLKEGIGFGSSLCRFPCFQGINTNKDLLWKDFCMNLFACCSFVFVFQFWWCLWHSNWCSSIFLDVEDVWNWNIQYCSQFFPLLQQIPKTKLTEKLL